MEKQEEYLDETVVTNKQVLYKEITYFNAKHGAFVGSRHVVWLHRSAVLMYGADWKCLGLCFLPERLRDGGLVMR